MSAGNNLLNNKKQNWKSIEGQDNNNENFRRALKLTKFGFSFFDGQTPFATDKMRLVTQ